MSWTVAAGADHELQATIPAGLPRVIPGLSNNSLRIGRHAVLILAGDALGPRRYHGGEAEAWSPTGVTHPPVAVDLVASYGRVNEH